MAQAWYDKKRLYHWLKEMREILKLIARNLLNLSVRKHLCSCRFPEHDHAVDNEDNCA